MESIFHQNLESTMSLCRRIPSLLGSSRRFIFLITFLVIGLNLAGLAETAPNNDQVSILVGGDITVGSRLTPILRRQGLDILFKPIMSEVQGADIALATLNTSISEKNEYRSCNIL